MNPAADNESARREAIRKARAAFAAEQAAAEAAEDATERAVVRRMRALDAERPERAA
jgi:hypothetical protein